MPRRSSVHTFNCGLYLVRGVDREEPSANFVHGFPGKDCGVPVLTSHYWLQTVVQTHALVALDIADPEHPREVFRVTFGDDEEPHWLATDPSGRRLVLNSAGYTKSNRLFVINFDPRTARHRRDRKTRRRVYLLIFRLGGTG